MMEYDALHSLGLEVWLAIDEKPLILGLLVMTRSDISNFRRSMQCILNSKGMNIVIGSTAI
jgi:hypothetical protein